jgi:adenosylhomocysteine nucleosidase
MTTTARAVVVVVGFAAEARMARRLGWQVAIGGGTAAGAEAAARRLVEEGATALISFGLAGGLDPVLRPGALIVPSAVIARDERHATDPDLSRMLGGTTPQHVHGADAIVASVEEKRRLWQRTAAAAVDLESGAVARIAAVHNIPFAVLRAICDPAECALPPAALLALNVRGGIRAWRVLASIAAHPAQLPALLALAADAAAAKRSLVARVKCVGRAPSWGFSPSELPR